jgi:predicted ribosomally synthesized peptide with SipW-like signal peptide
MRKNNKKDRRILVGAIAVAGVTAAGSTFAWFTSKDEVTNRLSASADYNVAIAEDFTPPEQWTPGQEINKDVSAVNTGNVDAFVRVGLLHDATLTVKDTGVAVSGFAAADKTKLVELKTSASDTNTPAGGNAVNNSANEVTLLQAGGTLVIAGGQVVTPSDAWNVRSGDSSNDDYSGNNQFDPAVTTVYGSTTDTYADTYGSGLYIFKRNTTDGVKYSGYYYDATNDKFYELEQEPGTVYIANLAADAIAEDTNGVVTLSSTTALDNVKLAATKKITIANNSATPAFNITWVKSDGNATTAGASDAAIIRLTYVGDDDSSANKALDDVVIDINLASGWSTNWTYKAATSTKIDGTNDVGYFFYNKLLAPGATSEKLVDSVTLNSAVTQEAYKDFVYDLTVVLDSIQASPNEAKTAASYVTAVNGAGWNATAAYNGTVVSWS